MRRHRQPGFTLIELMVSITVLGILLLVGIPSYEQWTQNTRIRTATESIQNGLRLARNQAAQQGSNVRFQLTTASGGWEICSLGSAAEVACPATASSILQQYTGDNGSDNVEVTTSTAVGTITGAGWYNATVGGAAVGSGVTYTSLARPSDYGNTSLLRIDVSAPAANARRLVTTISAGGMVNMCDPQITFSATSTQGCQ
jgi:type IV fimbrial biogenesis protein FimT